ncbi:SDR family oxidoreductase [Actinomadura alba]|uniref:SDR family oxidoreductase n=1 Tax=Actinomadura alba TaxID=406431 RepID=A0ABR7M1R5_9ACTN|nr:SDR family oxidoreductase [Actinomadura alba]MBC6471067.1 SDR family oxidoreductase [Actinomadura alba]
MKIADSVALVTGANRGIGRHFSRQLLQRGAAKVYATARTPELVDIPGVEVLQLDITDPASVAAAAAAAGDVTLLINNAGVSTSQNLVTGDIEKIRLEMETHYFGTLNMVRAFASILARNGGGSILNVMSLLSWLSYDGANAYSAAKAAEWSLTNAIRLELAGQGTTVTGLHLGSTDTDMMAGWDIDKNDPADVVRTALDGLEAGEIEILADENTVQVKAALSAEPSVLYPQTVSAA